MKLRMSVTVFVLSGVMGSTALATSYNEASDGDLSGARLNPTALTLTAGSNPVTATSVAGDLEYLQLSIPAGHRLTAITAVSNTSTGVSFIAVQRGAGFTEPPTGTTVSQLLGYTHFGSSNGTLGTDILDNMAVGPSAIGFVPPLSAGVYTFWIQETSGTPSTYALDFVLAASPAPVPISRGAMAVLAAMLALAGVVVLRRRSRGTRPARVPSWSSTAGFLASHVVGHSAPRRKVGRWLTSRPRVLFVVTRAVLAFVACFGAAGDASAQLDPAYVGKIDVNTAYVTDAIEATDIAFAADGRAVVTLKTGGILVRRANGTTTTIPYAFGGRLDPASEKGLLGVVADPNVAQNRAFYFYVSNGTEDSDKHRVYRAVLAATSDSFAVDATPIIAASRGLGPGLEGPSNHDGGGLVVYDGKLYVSVGDTGANATPPVNKYGSCLNKGNGKILRVNLDGSIPADNPLVGLTSVSACDSPRGPWITAPPDPRIFAWGFRNPWRFWVDPRTGLMWIGDVGEITQEDISIGPGNRHYGYPFVEASMVWGDVEGKNCSTLTPSRACTPPAFSYPRSVGQSITGGLIPEGCGWNGVFGGAHYIYADSSVDFIRALPVNGSRAGFSSSTPITVATFPGAPVSIRMGPDGAVYVVYNTSGNVIRFAPSARSGTDCGTPPAVPAGSPGLSFLLGVTLASVGLLCAAARQRASSRHPRIS